jgi:hypothetical protein
MREAALHQRLDGGRLQRIAAEAGAVTRIRQPREAEREPVVEGHPLPLEGEGTRARARAPRTTRITRSASWPRRSPQRPRSDANAMSTRPWRIRAAR